MKMYRPFSLILVLLLCPLLPAQGFAAAARNDDSAAEVKQQLNNVELQVEIQKQELAKQRRRAALMEKKVDCNWTLLNAYKACEDQYSKASADYLKCTGDAKQAYQHCMSAIETE